MEPIDLQYQKLEKRFVDWASHQEDIRAVVIVGSRSRADHLADEWSDLDLMIYVIPGEGKSEPDQYFKETGWLSEIGEVWMSLPSRTAGNDPEYLVTFAGGFNVDFVFNPYRYVEDNARAGGVPSVYRRGARVIVDKDQLAVKTLPTEFKAPLPPPPKREDFLWLMNAFWYTAFYLAKQLRRGDLVMAKQRDIDMKRCLIQIMEWHAQLTHPGTDTWHMGRYIEEWADPAAWTAFQGLFAHFDAAESWQSLTGSMALFRRLSIETSIRLEIPYPSEIEERATALVTQLENGGSLFDPGNQASLQGIKLD